MLKDTVIVIYLACLRLFRGEDKKITLFNMNRALRSIYLACSYRIKCFITFVTAIINILIIAQILIQDINVLYLVYLHLIILGFSYLVYVMDLSNEKTVNKGGYLIHKVRILYILDIEETFIYYIMFMVAGWLYFIWIRSLNIYLFLCVLSCSEFISIHFAFISRYFWFC